MSAFRKRSREEVIEIARAMAQEFDQAARIYKADAVRQMRDIEGGDVVDVNEAIHRAVHAVAFLRLAEQLHELVAIAEGRRSGERWQKGDVTTMR